MQGRVCKKKTRIAHKRVHPLSDYMETFFTRKKFFVDSHCGKGKLLLRNFSRDSILLFLTMFSKASFCQDLMMSVLTTLYSKRLLGNHFGKRRKCTGCRKIAQVVQILLFSQCFLAHQNTRGEFFTRRKILHIFRLYFRGFYFYFKLFWLFSAAQANNFKRISGEIFW